MGRNAGSLQIDGDAVIVPNELNGGGPTQLALSFPTDDPVVYTMDELDDISYALPPDLAGDLAEREDGASENQ